MIDVANGFAFPAIDLGVERTARPSGRRRHRCGGPRARASLRRRRSPRRRLAEAGLVALAFGNTPKAIAPWGGKRALFGTSPLAFAAPERNAPPIVVDMALSQVARGKTLTAGQRGEPIPADGPLLDETASRPPIPPPRSRARCNRWRARVPHWR